MLLTPRGEEFLPQRVDRRLLEALKTMPATSSNPSGASTPIHVGVNLLFIQPERNLGTFTYVKNLLNAMAKLPGMRLTLFTSSVNHELIASEIAGVPFRCPVRGSNLFTRGAYEQLRLCRLATRQGCDVLWCPGYLAPVSGGLPIVVTIHDMQYRDIPESVSSLKRAVYNAIVPRAARHAERVLAVSEFSKQRILHYTGIPGGNVVVTHEASFAPSENDEGDSPRDANGTRVDLPSKYFLSVSSGLPHKNIPRLIEAFTRAEGESASGTELVFVGSPPSPAAAEAAAQSDGAVRFLGYLPDDQLRQAYRQAHGFVLASYYEGFGLPVLEAMQHGLPVACSQAASLPEVAGDAAVLFDPHCVESIASGLAVLMREEGAERDARINLGYRNLQRFSWDRCAQETADVLRDAAGH